MRILWSANAPWAATGYGVQAAKLLPRFQALGHEVAHFAWYGLQGGTMQWGTVPIFPAGYDAYGNDIAPDYCRVFQADLYITLIDLWVQDPQLGQRISEACGQYVPWLAWFPVDSDPPYPGILERIPHVDYPIQYSQFGMRAAQAAGAPTCRYVPHGVDTSLFHPSSVAERARTRQQMGFPADAYVCAIVAANKGYPSRKAFDIQLQAFARFQRRHPEALLYLHSQTAEKQGGLDFAGMVKALGIPQETVRMVDQLQQHIGIPEDALARVYGAADVLLAASYAEGFGVPILEAQSCGVPVVTTNGTSMAELTVNGIATAPCQKFWSAIGGWWDTPSVAAIDEALEQIYGWPAEHRAAQSAKGVLWAAQNYDWDVCITKYWAPLLAEIEQDITKRRAKDAAAIERAQRPVQARKNGHKPKARVPAALPTGEVVA